MLRTLCSLSLLAFLFSSCTGIVSNNYPGKSEHSIPAEWQGRYLMTVPPSLSDMQTKGADGQMISQYVNIQQGKIIWDHSPEISVFTLNDSLIVSTVNEEKYISLRNPEGYYHVLQVKQRGNNLRLFPMYIGKELNDTDLKPYFDKVKYAKKADGATVRYEVRIIDKKLGDYFKSSFVSSEPIELVRQ